MPPARRDASRVGLLRLRAGLLLHGHPRTHATWHRVAPLLASDYTVVRHHRAEENPAALARALRAFLAGP